MRGIVALDTNIATIAVIPTLLVTGLVCHRYVMTMLSYRRHQPAISIQ